MAVLAGSIDELKADLLHSLLPERSQQGLSKSDNSLLGSHAASLDHDKVLVDLSVMREASHGSNGLVSWVIICGSVVLDDLAILGVDAFADAVDLLVDLGTVMVSLLTGTGHTELNSARMPCSNTGNLTQTFVRLPGQFLAVPSGCYTFKSSSSGHSDAVNVLILGKHLLNRYRLLQLLAGPVYLLVDGASVYLHLHDVGLLLAFLQKLHLGVSNDTDDFAVLLHLGKVSLDLLLAILILPFLGILGVGLLLGTVPSELRPTVPPHVTQCDSGGRVQR